MPETHRNAPLTPVLDNGEGFPHRDSKALRSARTLSLWPAPPSSLRHAFRRSIIFSAVVTALFGGAVSLGHGLASALDTPGHRYSFSVVETK